MNAPHTALPPNTPVTSSADMYLSSDSYGQFDQEHRNAGSFGAIVIAADQEEIDVIDPAVDEYIFTAQCSDMRDVGIDMGDGLIEHKDTKRGSFLVTPPDTAVRFRIPECHEVKFMTMPRETVDALLDEAGVTDSCFAPHYAGGKGYVPKPHLTTMVDWLWNVANRTLPHQGLDLDGLTLQFLAQAACSEMLSPLGADVAEDNRIARVVDYVEAHFGAPLTVAELAAVACLSPAHFSRVFKETKGEAVWSYVQRRRCERVHEALVTSEASLAQIAHDCGFSNQAHMTRAFRARFGVTPGAVRRGN